MRKLMADTLLVNGKFLTMESRGETAESVAVKDGKILYVGTNTGAEEYRDADTRILDLEGRLATPGLIDCHTHPIGYALRFSILDLRKFTSSRAEMREALEKEVAKTPKGRWVIGRGYDESNFLDDQTPPDRYFLDSISTEHPIYISRTCGHVSVLNSLGLEKSGFTDASVPPSTGGHFFKDENGHLTGMISGSVAAQVPLPPSTLEQIESGMVNGVQKECFRAGVTAIGEMGARKSVRGIQNVAVAKKLKLKVGYYYSARRKAGVDSIAERLASLGLCIGFGTPECRFLGIKFVLDGSTGGRTAAFSQPYLDNAENRGELYYDDETLREDLLLAAKTGIQISIHAIGDRAIEQALQALEYVESEGFCVKDLRCRLEHLESPTADQIRRIQKLGLIIGLSSAFIYHLGDSHLAALGYDRLVDAFPAKSLQEHGILFACNSDCTVCDINPMYGIYSMVARKTLRGKSFGGKKEAIDRLSALEAYTKNSAYLLWADDTIGTLKEGKSADIVVFKEDLLTIPEEEIKTAKVHMTLVGGEIVYQDSEN